MIHLGVGLFLEASNASVAQLVEQSPEKACVGGSSPPRSTILRDACINLPFND